MNLFFKWKPISKRAPIKMEIKSKIPINPEFKAQAEALSMMHGPTLDLIFEHGAEFREIIDDFAEKFGRVPSANDIVWIASEHAGRNLRKPDE